MVVNTNQLTLSGRNQLKCWQPSIETAIKCLSSGLRINWAKDDAAGRLLLISWKQTFKQVKP
ncbi:MAG: hypothetical protein GYB28_10965 [Gammaproteobacteria bacterium]|nr:hypothetical protein [Gammaproteobacteria bacterium]